MAAGNVRIVNPVEAFSPDYRTARERFRAAARTAGAKLEALPVAGAGPQGEALTVDLAWFGAARPERVLLHSSGLHGLEGFTGSAIQLQALAAPPALPTGTALAFVHVLNPWGMAWRRRPEWNGMAAILAQCYARVALRRTTRSFFSTMRLSWPFVLKNGNTLRPAITGVSGCPIR